MRRRRRDERGTALVEVTWLAILLLVPLVYVVLVGLRGAARGVRRQRRRPGRRPRLHARAVGRRGRAPGPARPPPSRSRDQGLDLRDGHAGADLRRRDPRDCLSPGSVVHVRMALPGRAAADARRRWAATPRASGSTPSTPVPYGTFREDRP